MPDYQVSGEKKREIGNKKQPEAWVWASAVGWRGIFAKVSGRLKPDLGSDGLFRIRGGLMLIVLYGKLVKS